MHFTQVVVSIVIPCSILVMLLVACASSTLAPLTPTPVVGSCGLALPETATDEEAVRAVLRAEGELVVQQAIDPLMALWAEGASVTDAKHTPADAVDDQVWLDRDAIRHRYVRIVFPGAAQQAEPADLTLEWEEARVVITATTRIGDEVSPDGDRWVLVKVNGCWLLESLTYNLEPEPQ